MRGLCTGEVLSLHALLTEQTGGAPGVRDPELLESALATPFMSFDGVELYPTAAQKGARLAYALIRNHAFVDGNKRIGMLCLFVSLELWGVHFAPPVSEVARMGFAVAAGEMGYEELLSFVEQHIKE